MAHEPDHRQCDVHACHRDEAGKELPPKLLLLLGPGRALCLCLGSRLPHQPHHVLHAARDAVQLESSLPQRLLEIASVAAAAQLLVEPRCGPAPHQGTRRSSSGKSKRQPTALRPHARAEKTSELLRHTGAGVGSGLFTPRHLYAGTGIPFAYEVLESKWPRGKEGPRAQREDCILAGQEKGATTFRKLSRNNPVLRTNMFRAVFLQSGHNVSQPGLAALALDVSHAGPIGPSAGRGGFSAAEQSYPALGRARWVLTRT